MTAAPHEIDFPLVKTPNDARDFIAMYIRRTAAHFADAEISASEIIHTRRVLNIVADSVANLDFSR